MFELKNPLRLQSIHEMTLEDCKNVLEQIRSTRLKTFNILKKAKDIKNQTKKFEKLVAQLEKLLNKCDDNIDKLSETIMQLELLQFQQGTLLFDNKQGDD